MIRKPNRRDIVKTAATLAAAGCLTARYAPPARANMSGGQGSKALREIDRMLRAATHSGDLPGVVALAATDSDIVYEGIFGERRLHEGPGMTRDTIFRIASMVKLITSVAALQLVERNKLSLDAPVPKIEPALGEPLVLDGFDKTGTPELRPAKTPISLRQLLTHTSGFAYRLWDAKALRYAKAVDELPAGDKVTVPRTPLMFDPGERWQYGGGIDWVGRMVEQAAGEPLQDYFRKHILGPLGMNDTAFVISPEQYKREASAHRRQPNGSLTPLPVEKQASAPGQSFSGGGGIYSTASDYLSLIRALMQGGALGGTRILEPETVALMGQNQIGDIDVGVLRTTAPAVSNDVDLFPAITRKWGFGHMINMQPVPQGRSAGSMTWGGILNTYYWIDPQRQVAAVFMTQILPFADVRALRLYRQFERSVYAAAQAG
jgi:CubicO group peptidase (beta-lactamase class C family)